MNKYEAIYIIDTAMEEVARNELIARFNELISANGGTLEKIDEWGKRRLAYTIDYKNEGYYVLLHFSSGPELPRELERNMQNNENILRYLIVKQEQKRSSVKPRTVPLRPAPAFIPHDSDAPAPVASPIEAAPVEAAPATIAPVEAAAEIVNEITAEV